MAAFKEYENFDGLGLAALVKSKDVTVQEVLDAAFERVEKYNPKVNSVVHVMKEVALRDLEQLPAEGDFYGVPFLIKDLLLCYSGTPTTASSRFLKDFVPQFDSELMIRYKKAGVVTIGKTNTPEFGILGVTEPELRGPCRNPWDLNLTPGGSSGGAGASVASRMVPIAHGGDGGGSIRIPGSACGLFGLKPTRGRLPSGPMRSESNSWMGLVSEHILSRSVRDSAKMLDLTHGNDIGAAYCAPHFSGKYFDLMDQPPKSLKIAFTHQSLFGKETHADCRAALDSSIELCRELGHEVTEDLPQFNKMDLVQSYLIIVGASVSAGLSEVSAMTGKPLKASGFEPGTWFLNQVGQVCTAQELTQALNHIRKASQDLADFFQKYDLFMTPTLAHPPSPIGLMDLSFVEQLGLKIFKTVPVRSLILQAIKQMADGGLEKTPNTQLFNLTGCPAMSVPLFWNSQNIPIGTQFAAAFGREDLLFQLAAQLEKARPWENNKPSLII